MAYNYTIYIRNPLAFFFITKSLFKQILIKNLENFTGSAKKKLVKINAI